VFHLQREASSSKSKQQDLEKEEKKREMERGSKNYERGRRRKSLKMVQYSSHITIIVES
jgi:hypothetical protein